MQVRSHVTEWFDRRRLSDQTFMGSTGRPICCITHLVRRSLAGDCIVCLGFRWLHWRFSLRTLLIATTLVAVVLGLIAVRSTIM